MSHTPEVRHRVSLADVAAALGDGRQSGRPATAGTVRLMLPARARGDGGPLGAGDDPRGRVCRRHRGRRIPRSSGFELGPSRISTPTTRGLTAPICTARIVWARAPVSG